jgi:hypothetical protein
MGKYRIIKETTTNTNKVTYYIERKKKFLIWGWWSKLELYHAGYDIHLILSYSTYEEAKKELDRLTDQIKTEVFG